MRIKVQGIQLRNMNYSLRTALPKPYAETLKVKKGDYVEFSSGYTSDGQPYLMMRKAK